MSDYRDPGKARSPALEKLAAEARVEERAAAPAQTALLPAAEVTRRLELAVGVHGDRPGCLPIVALFASMFAIYALILVGKDAVRVEAEDTVLVGLLVVAAVASVAGSIYGAGASEKRRAAAIERELRWATAQPFPVTGYRDWLVNDRPVMIVELRDPLDKTTFVDAVKAIDPAIETTATGEATFELAFPSRVVAGEHPSRYASVPLLRSVFDKLVLPLHGDVGIVRVAMGGTIHDRS